MRNRLLRAGCYEGLARAGEVSEPLIEHHRRLAAGGRAYADQLLARAELLPDLRRLVQAVHDQGAAVSVQLVHCGFTARRPLYMLRGNVPVREMAANQSSALLRLGLGLFGNLFEHMEEGLRAGCSLLQLGRATIRDKGGCAAFPRSAASSRAPSSLGRLPA
jgi:hypothetical protein